MTAQLISLLMALLNAMSISSMAASEIFSLGEYLVLVNRNYLVSSTYEPEDLVRPDVRHDSSAILMRKEAAEALEDLFAAAEAEEGYRLIAASGYRSYRTQELIFDRKVKNLGSVAKAQLLVAPPGASEHQLGLAMDIKCPGQTNLNAAFAKTEEGQWLRDNAHRFGFIIRYKEEWTDITGYAYEPWHIRYIGKTHAQIVYEMNIPLEEYISLLRLISEDTHLKGF